MAIKRKLPSKQNVIKDDDVNQAAQKPADTAASKPADDAKAAPDMAPEATASRDSGPSTPFFDEGPISTAHPVEEDTTLPPAGPPPRPPVADDDDTRPMEMDRPAGRPQPGPESFSSLDPAASPGTPAGASWQDDPVSGDTTAPAPPPWKKRAPSATELLGGDDDLAPAARPSAMPPRPNGPGPQTPPKMPPSAPTGHAPGAEEDSWEIGDLVDMPSSGMAPPASPAPDPYAPSGAPKTGDEGNDSPFDRGPKLKSPKVPPWRHSAKPGDTPPQLPPDRGQRTAAGGGSMVGTFITLTLVLILGVVGFMFVKNREKAIEMIARWTGTLNQVSQELPADQQASAQKTGQQMQHPGNAAMGSAMVGTATAAQGAMSPPAVPGQGVALASTTPGQAVQSEAGIGAPKAQPANAPQGAQGAQQGAQAATPTPTDGHVKVDFADVPPAEAKQPITADGSEAMPPDVSALAKLQKQIIDKQKTDQKTAQAAGDGGDQPHMPTPPVNPREDISKMTPEQVSERNANLIGKTRAGLDAYRKALAAEQDPALHQKPGQFLGQLDQMDDGSGRPVNQYANPTVKNPLAMFQKKETGVRTLSDFESQTSFQPDQPQIRFPKNIRPQIGAGDFPPLEILSLVPNYGLIGINRGHQGALLIGETIEGWELVSVYSNYAEFHQGDRKHIVMLNNADSQP